MLVPSVREVMTRNVVAVRGHAGYQEVVDALTAYGVSALPVVDAWTRVVGVVSEADLLPKLDAVGAADRAKADADTAAELMTAPAITIGPDEPVVAAVRLMTSAAVKRLPVVDAEGRLVGIVARSDLLRVLRWEDAEPAGI